MIAQHNIQQFLKYYQEKRKITILLTSHYMKDVAALCQRVVIIAQGKVQYDGSLKGILDRFSGSKIVTLQLAGEFRPDEFSQYGEVLKAEPPRLRIKIARADVPRHLSHMLAQQTVEDIAVEDPPLEEVIADVFSQVQADQRASDAKADAAD